MHYLVKELTCKSCFVVSVAVVKISPLPEAQFATGKSIKTFNKLVLS